MVRHAHRSADLENGERRQHKVTEDGIVGGYYRRRAFQCFIVGGPEARAFVDMGTWELCASPRPVLMSPRELRRVLLLFHNNPGSHAPLPLLEPWMVVSCGRGCPALAMCSGQHPTVGSIPFAWGVLGGAWGIRARKATWVHSPIRQLLQHDAVALAALSAPVHRPWAMVHPQGARDGGRTTGDILGLRGAVPSQTSRPPAW